MKEVFPKIQPILESLNDQVHEIIRMSYNCNELLCSPDLNNDSIEEIKDSNCQLLDQLSNGYLNNYTELISFLEVSKEDLHNLNENKSSENTLKIANNYIKREYDILIEFLENRCSTDVIETIESSVNKIVNN